jgi:hypothetical protein
MTAAPSRTGLFALLAFAALLLLALLSWWSMRVGSSAAEASPGPERLESGAPALLGTRPDAETTESLVTQSSGKQREQVAPSTASDPTCRIRVVEAASRAPVPDARVWIQREDADLDSPAWWKTMRRFNDVEPVLQSGFGDELTLDARAEVIVPCPVRARILVAARGDLHGEATLELGKSECVVELKPYHALTIEVVDRTEHPVAGALRSRPLGLC